MLLRKVALDAMHPDQWMRPFACACLAAHGVLFADVYQLSSGFVGRSTAAHAAWNRWLLLALILFVLLDTTLRSIWGEARRAGAGLCLAAFGLMGRGLTEGSLVVAEHWALLRSQTERLSTPMIEAARWLGLAAFFVGLTLFAVEVVGTWVDRRALRT